MSKLGPSGKGKRRGRRKRMDAYGTKPGTASEVKVTRADGTVEVQPAYTPDELRAIDAKARRKPRTWNEINSARGGGADGTFVT